MPDGVKDSGPIGEAYGWGLEVIPVRDRCEIGGSWCEEMPGGRDLGVKMCRWSESRVNRRPHLGALDPWRLTS